MHSFGQLRLKHGILGISLSRDSESGQQLLQRLTIILELLHHPPGFLEHQQLSSATLTHPCAWQMFHDMCNPSSGTLTYHACMCTM